MDASHGLDSPRFVELVDLDGSGTLDVLISANNNLYLASNEGQGVYETNTFSISVLAPVGGSCLLTRSIDLTSDDLIDVVYLTSSGAPAVLVQTVSGFNAPVSLPSHPVSPIVLPTDLAIIPATPSTRVTLAVSDASIPYISLFEAKASLDGQFEQPVLINVGTGVNCLSLVDLDRKPDSMSYSFIGGEDQDDFNETRFRNEGRCSLSFLPILRIPRMLPRSAVTTSGSKSRTGKEDRLSKTSQYRSTSITKPLILSELTPTWPQPTVRPCNRFGDLTTTRTGLLIPLSTNTTKPTLPPCSG